MSIAHVLHLLLRSMVLPPLAPLLLMLIGWVTASWHPRAGRSLAATGFVLLWLLSTPAVAYRLEAWVERYPPIDWTRASQAQALVILSAGARPDAPEYGEDAPDDDTLQRILYGAEVARRTHLPILVSGGYVGMHRSLGATMQVFLERDLQTPVRWVEGTSFDTHENAINTAAILLPLGVRRIVLVTSATHMARSVGEFETVGFTVVPAPMDFVTDDTSPALAWVPGYNGLHRSFYACYEILGELVRHVRLAVHGR